MKRTKFSAIALLVLLNGCSAPRRDALAPFESETVITAEQWASIRAYIENLDTGDSAHFNACKATPRRPLTAAERCFIAALSARCTEQDDCHVSCWNSRDGMSMSGGCYHRCGLLESNPPGWAECEALEARED
jgi:hypothetical protein